jgi:hypothetical protein
MSLRHRTYSTPSRTTPGRYHQASISLFSFSGSILRKPMRLRPMTLAGPTTDSVKLEASALRDGPHCRQPVCWGSVCDWTHLSTIAIDVLIPEVCEPFDKSSFHVRSTSRIQRSCFGEPFSVFRFFTRILTTTVTHITPSAILPTRH